MPEEEVAIIKTLDVGGDFGLRLLKALKMEDKSVKGVYIHIPNRGLVEVEVVFYAHSYNFDVDKLEDIIVEACTVEESSEVE